MLSVSEHQISFSIVVPNPNGEEESSNGPELPSETTQGSGNAITKLPIISQTGYASVSVISPVTKAILTRSCRVEVGDIIILEDYEELSAVKPKDICLVSVLHATEPAEAGQGGWVEATVDGDERTLPVA
jgi:hypothetical protein